jgi:DNA-directed RNA polymerase specialized sigma24 family protein
VAIVALAKRRVLLGVHRHRLRWEDLEDCYSQATLELVILARQGRRFAGRRHIGNALEQRFLARVQDRRRALSGRSAIAAALEGAVPFGSRADEADPPDPRGDPERLAIARAELARVRAHARSLTDDQRLVLAAQVSMVSCESFCRLHGWSPEKYRKVAQRGRAKLARLMAEEAGCPVG